MNYNAYSGETGAIPVLSTLNGVVDTMWSSAINAQPDQYPGFTVTHDGIRASFMVQHTPTAYDRVSMYRSPDGVWTVEEQRQRPALETEGFGNFTRTTTISTLLPGAMPTSITEQDGPGIDPGEFAPQTIGAREHDLDDADCQRILGTLRYIRGEREQEQRSSRIRGWLARIGIGRKPK